MTVLRGIVALSFFFAGITLAAAAPVDLPKTGQATCYSTDGTVIDCAGTGQDGDIQAGTDWPSPRFTDHGNGTITDNLTGLMWLQNGRLLWTNENPPVWDVALTKVDTLNFFTFPQGQGDYDDWRIPNAIELHSLNNASEADSSDWLITQGFTNMSSEYWTSTTFLSENQYYLGKAVNNFFSYGGTMGTRNKKGVHGETPAIAVRTATPGKATWRTGQTLCYNSLNTSDDPGLTYAQTIIDCADTGQDGELQKGVPWPTPRFTDNLDGTVTDNLSGLVWLKDANCMSTEYPEADTDKGTTHAEGDGWVIWQSALDFVAGINDGTYSECGAGHTDWHLPNRIEALSLIDFSTLRSQGSLPAGHPFVNTAYGIWTSTTDAKNPAKAFVVSLTSVVPYKTSHAKDGLDFRNNLNELGLVWPVRVSGIPVTCVDNDEDGYGDPANANCDYPELDCDDSNPHVNPGEEEVCDNGIDDNCDGKIDAADSNCKSGLPWIYLILFD
jgi:hypothetical protein